MALPATAQLEFINQLSLDSETRIRRSEAESPRPELAGLKVRITGTTPIYIIDPKGYRRLIPFPLTFLNLFRDEDMLQMLVSSAVADIAEGPALDDGALLLRGRSSERIYLLDGGKKRLISRSRIMEKYGFNEESVVVAHQILVDAVPEGEIWE